MKNYKKIIKKRKRDQQKSVNEAYQTSFEYGEQVSNYYATINQFYHNSAIDVYVNGIDLENLFLE
jgi:hypothetical protein